MEGLPKPSTSRGSGLGPRGGGWEAAIGYHELGLDARCWDYEGLECGGLRCEASQESWRTNNRRR